MSILPSVKARALLQALLRKGWVAKRQSGSHRTLAHPDWPDYTFPFHDGDEIGPRMLARIAKHTGLDPTDLWADCCAGSQPTHFRRVNSKYTAAATISPTNQA